MLKIKVQDIDELYAISEELETIAYLQSLVRYDLNSSTIKDPELYFAHDHAECYLLDRQADAVLRLQSLISKDNFINR